MISTVFLRFSACFLTFMLNYTTALEPYEPQNGTEIPAVCLPESRCFAIFDKISKVLLTWQQMGWSKTQTIHMVEFALPEYRCSPVEKLIARFFSTTNG